MGGLAFTRCTGSLLKPRGRCKRMHRCLYCRKLPPRHGELPVSHSVSFLLEAQTPPEEPRIRNLIDLLHKIQRETHSAIACPAS